MKKTRIVKDSSGVIDLLETYSTEGYKLKQIETGKVYGASVVDAIITYRDLKPVIAFTYEETDIKDEIPTYEEEEIING